MLEQLEEFEKKTAGLAGDSGADSSNSEEGFGEDPNMFTLSDELLQVAGGMATPTWDTSVENLG